MDAFHFTFIVLFLAMALVRTYYRLQARTDRKKQRTAEPATVLARVFVGGDGNALDPRLLVPSTDDGLVEPPVASGVALDWRRDLCGIGCRLGLGPFGVGEKLQF
jgi:hypothetical protein